MAFDELEDVLDDPAPIKSYRLKCERIRFHTNSVVPHPDCLIVFEAVYRFVADPANAGVKVLIASHTDTVGTKESNQTLSDERSESIGRLVSGNVKTWAQWVTERQTRLGASKVSLDKDVEQTLAWAAAVFNWPDVKPGAPKAKRRLKEQVDAIYDKVTFEEAQLADAADETFWWCVAMLFRLRLIDRLDVDPMKFFPDYVKKLVPVDPDRPTIGCGERCPIEDLGDEKKSAANRRTEFLFFKPGEEPPRTDEAPAADGLPPPWLEAACDRKRAKFRDLDCPKPEFFRIPVPDRANLIFVIDVSGSMKQAMSTGRTRLAMATSELVDVLRDVTTECRITLISFSTKVQVLWSDPPQKEDDPLGLQARPICQDVTDATRKQAIDWVNGLVADGGTYTRPALMTAFRSTRLLSGEGVETHVYLLSDGNPNPVKGQAGLTDTPPAANVQLGSKNERTFIANNLKGWNYRGFHLNCVGFLTAAEAELEAFLKDLAEKRSEPPGKFTARKPAAAGR